MTQTRSFELRDRNACESPAIEPAVDIVERPNDVVLLIDLPGCTEPDVEVTVEKDSIQIDATPHTPSDTQNAHYYREFLPARFSRSFALSSEADRDAIEATLDQGVLQLNIPRSKTDRNRKIEVRPRAN